jgi:ketosteroid isomerase-like protein
VHAMAGPIDPHDDPADSHNLRVVKQVYDTIQEQGVEAGIERMLSEAHEDFEFRPYVAAGRVLRGAGEVRAFFREQREAGTTLALRPASFEEHGDEVVVQGSVRVTRPGGGFSESQITWTYRFREGRLEEAHWSPRQGS